MHMDEWVEFLKQSIESHDRQLGALTDKVARVDAQIEALTGRVDALTTRLDRFVEVTQLNFDRLTKAMLGLTEHVADHGRRISRLEEQA